MAGIVDERMAAATGSRVNKIYQQSQVLARSQGTTAPVRDGSHVELVIHHGDPVATDDEKTSSRLCLWWSSNTQSSSGLPRSGSLIYVIVLIVMVASVFGLEFYRIRESGHLNQRINLLQEEMEILRHEFVESLKPNSNIGEINMLRSGIENKYATLKAPLSDIFQQPSKFKDQAGKE